MATWSDVGLAAVGGVIGIGGTLGATGLSHWFHGRDQTARERTEWVKRGAAILGPLHSLLVDADPQRVSINARPESLEMFRRLQERWEGTLRDELATFATAHPAEEIRVRANVLSVAVANSLITTGWLLHDMLNRHDLQELQRARDEHALAEEQRAALATVIREWGSTGKSHQPRTQTRPE